MGRATDLLAALDGFVAADALETAHLGAVRRLLEAGDRAFGRDHYAPGHITASAFVLDPTRTRLLLIHHQKLERWLQPGGHVEPEDRDIEAATRRELHEEVGLTELTRLGGIFDVDVHPIPARKNEPEHRHFDVRLLFVSHGAEVRAGSDAKAAKWVPFAEVRLAESDASVLRAVQKLVRGV